MLFDRGGRSGRMPVFCFTSSLPFRALVLKTLARTTPLVKAVLLTKVIAVCVLLDSRVGIVGKVKVSSHDDS